MSIACGYVVIARRQEGGREPAKCTLSEHGKSLTQSAFLAAI